MHLNVLNPLRIKGLPGCIGIIQKNFLVPRIAIARKK